MYVCVCVFFFFFFFFFFSQNMERPVQDIEWLSRSGAGAG